MKFFELLSIGFFLKILRNYLRRINFNFRFKIPKTDLTAEFADFLINISWFSSY